MLKTKYLILKLTKHHHCNFDAEIFLLYRHTLEEAQEFKIGAFHGIKLSIKVLL